jgi:tetratricopeptide (TPR) repeat protein
MQAKDTDAAGSVLKAKWTRLANLDSGLQYAAHLHALHLDIALDDQLHDILVRCGKEPDSLARIGDFWLNRAVLAKAERAYLDGLNKGSQRSLYITRLAELDARQGRPAEARRRLDVAVQQSPDDPLLQAHLAAIDLQSGVESARAKAQLELELILQRMPRSSFVRYHLGRAYLRLGDVIRAAQQFERCVRLDPNYAPGWLALAETDLEQGHVVHARNRIDRILSHAPRLPSALLLKSKIHALQGEFAKAGEVLDTVSTLGGPEWEVRLRRAELKLLSGSVREAAALLELCVLERPEDPRALLLLARAEIADGKSHSALARLRPFAGRQDAPETLLSEFASLSLSSGDTQTARQVYRILMDRFPGKVGYRVGMADALALSGKPDEAMTHYGAAQQAAPNELPAWLHAAALQSSLGRFAIARETYRKALTLAPGNAVVQNNLAYVLARTGEQLDYALELAQQAEQLMPGDPEIQDTLVYIHARRGMRQQALSTLERMLARSRGPERDQLLLLHSQLGQGQLEAAARGMEEARDRTLSTRGRHS